MNIRIQKAIKKHSELLKLVKAFELLYDRKPEVKYKGYATPWGHSPSFALESESFSYAELDKITSRYVYPSGCNGSPYLIDEGNYHHVILY